MAELLNTQRLDLVEIVTDLADLATRSSSEDVIHNIQQRFGPHFGLDTRDDNGCTLLHVLTLLSDLHPNEQSYMVVFDAIINMSTRWWSTCRKTPYDEGNDAQNMEYKYQAVQYLTTSVDNKSGLDVTELAFKLANVRIVDRLLRMENVRCFRVDNKIRYDATQLTPLTNETITQCCSHRNKVSPKPSLVEWLMSQTSLEKIGNVLDLEPMRRIENKYRFYTMLSYIALLVVHIAYMITFSCCGVILMEHQRTGSNENIASIQTLFYCVVPLEPVSILAYASYLILRLILCRGEVSVMIRMRTVGVQYFWLMILILYVFVVAALIYQYSTNGHNQHNLLSVALLYGWLLMLPLTRGISQIHYLWKVLKSIFLKDVYKILIIYAFVLLGFSLALHVQFQISAEVIAVFVNPFYTMFNLFNIMVGMGELFPGTTEANLEGAGGSTLYIKILYIMYVASASIVLLNMLIAMMNTSYYAILEQQTLSWRIESLELGLDLERNFSFLARCIPPARFPYGRLNPNPCPDTGDRWYIEVDHTKPGKKQRAHDLHAKVDRVSERMELLENRVMSELRRIGIVLEDMKRKS